MPRRLLTKNEKIFLTDIFGLTLPYNSQLVDTNDSNWGGSTNSITPFDMPYMTKSVWSPDYSNSSVSNRDRGIFVHEMMHVWQYFHGVNKAVEMISITYKFLYYERAYDYTLRHSWNIRDYNMEAQASIVQDSYLISVGELPTKNVGPAPQLSDYFFKMFQVKSAGPPTVPADMMGMASLGVRQLNSIPRRIAAKLW